MKVKDSKPTRIIAYIRVSTVDQVERGISLEAQAVKARQYANLYELNLVDLIEDRGETGKSLQRPGLQRVLKCLEAGKADGVLVVKLDRLTRSVSDLGYLLEHYFCDGGSSLLSVSENIDTRTAAGRLVLNVLGAVSQWEREAIGERTKDALAHLRKQGVRMGREGLGWEYSKRKDSNGHYKLHPRQDEMVTVQRIHELYKHKLSLREIASILTREGRKTKRGGRWHPETVRKVLARATA